MIHLSLSMMMMMMMSSNMLLYLSHRGFVILSGWCLETCHGPLARYVKLPVAHALGMPGTFSPPPRVSDPDTHHGTCVTHVPWCMPGSLTSGFLWSRWWGKLSRHSRRMCNPEFYVSGKRTIASGNVSHPSLCRLLLLTTTIPATWHSADPFHKGFMSS